VLASVTERGAGFRSLKDAWADTTTRHGRLMLTVLGGLAEFERELIRTRTGEGCERVKTAGVRFDRPLKMTDHQRREALQRMDAGESVVDFARTFGVDRRRFTGCRRSSPHLKEGAKAFVLPHRMRCQAPRPMPALQSGSPKSHELPTDRATPVAEALQRAPDERAAKLDPIIKALRAEGITSSNGIAEALNKRRIRAASVSGMPHRCDGCWRGWRAESAAMSWRR
jgi:hypothetical protein